MKAKSAKEETDRAKTNNKNNLPTIPKKETKNKQKIANKDIKNEVVDDDFGEIIVDEGD